YQRSASRRHPNLGHVPVGASFARRRTEPVTIHDQPKLRMNSIGIFMKDRSPRSVPWRIDFLTAACLGLAMVLSHRTAEAQVTNLWTINGSQVPVPNGPNGTGDNFGYVMVGLGGGRFAVSSPLCDIFQQGITITNAGAFWTGDQTGAWAGPQTRSSPFGDK